MSGFITLDRALWDHPIFAKSPMTELEAFAWMVKTAAWADTKHRIGVDLVDVLRGSFMITLREMQAAFMWQSDKKVRNFLKKLENHGIISVLTVGKRNARKTHVTICNYEDYQSPGRSKDAAKTHRGRTGDAVKKQDNKITKEDTNVSSGKRRGSRLSHDWFLPADWGQWSIDEGWSEDTIRAESDKFKDYWHSVAGAKGVKLDWFATWRNWMRNVAKPKQHLKAINGGSHATSRTDPTLDAIAIAARMRRSPGALGH